MSATLTPIPPNSTRAALLCVVLLAAVAGLVLLTHASATDLVLVITAVGGLLPILLGRRTASTPTGADA